MEMATLCAAVAALIVLPNKSQFFQYESVMVNCSSRGNSPELRVKRNTSTHVNQECLLWNRTDGSTCVIPDLYPSDSGLYWCESGAGQCSDATSITVTAGAVILESPALPLREGQAVTLRCMNRNNSSNATAHFYKDRRLLGSSFTGSLIIHRVSRSDEGLYRCSSGGGASPPSRLTVRVGRLEAPSSHFAYVLLPVGGLCLLLGLALLCVWRNHKVDRDVSYVDVIVTLDAPQRIRGEALESVHTFYSTLNLTAV